MDHRISLSYLIGVTTAELWWHLSNMNVKKGFNHTFYNIKIILAEKLTNRNLVIPTPELWYNCFLCLGLWRSVLWYFCLLKMTFFPHWVQNSYQCCFLLFLPGIADTIEYQPGLQSQLIGEQASLDTCDENCRESQVSTRVVLETKHIGKGCDRDTYSIQSQRKICGELWLYHISYSSYNHYCGLGMDLTHEGWNKMADNL